jgi:hypothetical protein
MENKKRIRISFNLSIMVLSFSIIFLFLSNSSIAWTGTGTINDPYLIKTADDLTTLATNVNSGTTYSGQYFQMTNDIDLSGKNFTPIGGGLNTDKSFQGIFDGNFHIIKNLTISVTVTSSRLGLFGYLGAGGKIENLGMVDATITTSREKKVTISDAGILVGYMGGETSKTATIINCYVYNGNIVGGWNNGNHWSGTNIGGLVGTTNTYTNIDNVYINISMTNAHADGGIVGSNNNNNSTNSVVSAYYSSNSTNVNNNGIGKQLTTTSTPTLEQFQSNPGQYLSGVFGNDAFNLNGGFPVFKKQDVIIPANNTTTISNPVTIENGCAITDNSNQITSVILKRYLKVSKWNLFGRSINKLTSTNAEPNIGILNTNTGINATTGETNTNQHDMVAVAYDYSTNNWNSTFLGVNFDAQFNNGVGYFVWPLATSIGNTETYTDDYIVVTQAGTVNNTDFSLTLNNTGANVSGQTNKAYWFSLSNPYIGKLDVSKFTTANSITGGTVYTFDPTKGTDGTWIAKSTNDYIYPAEGFMVGKEAATSFQVNFKRNQQYGYTSTKQETTSKFKPLEDMINFNVTANDITKRVYANINNEAENSFDDYDAFAMMSNSEDIVEPYFLIDNRQILKDEFKTLPYQVPINFHASKVSNTTLTTTNIPNDVTVSIVDLSNGQEVALENGSTFNFVANEGENEGRFVVKFGKNNVSIDNNARENNVSLSMYPNPATTSTTLIVEGLTNSAKVFVNDIQGRTLNTYTINKGQTHLKINTEKFTSGVYYIKVITNNLTKTEKLIVK